ncbi:tyrosine-protein phosphatase [Denitrobacterium detoxificans]|nr:tyrosine-protein phosphatase [Denitrobacterium detoxificans]
MRDLPHIMNFRDLGGMATSDGYIIKPRKLYRCAALGATDANERALLAGYYNVGTVIDLRTGLERNSNPDPDLPGVTHLEVPLMPVSALSITLEDYNWQELLRGTWSPDLYDACALYRKMVSPTMAPRWHQIFQVLLEAGDQAVLWHCTNGKDRTGVVAAVVLLALGIPEETVLADYMDSNSGLADYRAKILQDARDRGVEPSMTHRMGPLLEARYEHIAAAIEAIDGNFGDFAGFLEDVCGVGLAEEDTLRSIFLQ